MVNELQRGSTTTNSYLLALKTHTAWNGTKVSLLWGQFISNGKTSGKKSHFSSVFCGSTLFYFLKYALSLVRGINCYLTHRIMKLKKENAKFYKYKVPLLLAWFFSRCTRRLNLGRTENAIFTSFGGRNRGVSLKLLESMFWGAHRGLLMTSKPC